MTTEEYEALPVEQRYAMRRLQTDSGYTWEEFLRKCVAPTPIHDYVGVREFHGMFVGIEADGYTHT